MTEAEEIAELRAACGPADGELIAKLAHVINNPNHALLLNTSLLRNVWSDVEPLLDALAGKEPDLWLAGVPWAEMREVVPKLLDESLGCARRISKVITALREEAD